MSEQPLQVRLSADDGRYMLTVTGELDVVSASELESAVRRIFDRGGGDLRIDMSELTFMDSTGLRTVLLARELCERHGCNLSIVPGPPRVQRLFEVTGLLDVLQFSERGETSASQHDGRGAATAGPS